MGAFFLSPIKFQIPSCVREVFKKQGFHEPLEFEFANYRVLLFKKQLIDYFQAVNINESTLLAIGTCFYKNREVRDGLNLFLNDFINHSLDLSAVVGSFLILIWHENRLFFLSDKSGVQNIYFNDHFKIASSSFLSTITALSGLSGKLKLNREALTEILITGNLIGPETLVEEITRFEPLLHKDLFEIERISANKEISVSNLPTTFNEAIDEQVQTLSNYFKQISENINSLGSISGLTGGFDSRLLFLFIREKSSHCRLYCTSRENMTDEHICARKFAEAANKILYSQEHKKLTKLEPEYVAEFISDSFFFNDGIIRTNQIWLEEIKSRKYLIKLYGKEKLGFSGVGGEQYRNSDYLIKNTYNLYSWVKYELIYRNCGNVFSKSRLRDQTISRISGKIRLLLNIGDQRKTISKKEIKRYYNECWNPANRTVRNNIENQLLFFLSPFTEHGVSQFAYRAIPFLGHYHKFEKDMIYKLSPELSGVKTNYGYSPNQSGLAKFRAIPVLKGILGLRIYNFIYFNHRKKNQSGNEEVLKTHKSLSKYLEIIEKLGLPVSVNELCKNDLLAPLIIEAGYFLHKMGKDIMYD